MNEVMSQTEQNLQKIIEGISLKKIGREDVGILVNIDEQCFEDLYWNKEEFLEELELPSFYGFLATREESPIGYIIGHNEKHNDKEIKSKLVLPFEGAYLSSCAVMPDVRKKGVFRELFTLFEKVTQSCGLKYITLHARTEDNPENKDHPEVVFKKMGFQVVTRINDFYEKNDAVYKMTKMLGGL